MISRDNARLYEEPLPDKNECAFLHMSLSLIMLIELCYMKDVEYDIDMNSDNLLLIMFIELCYGIDMIFDITPL